jgi:hypothetical protein
MSVRGERVTGGTGMAAFSARSPVNARAVGSYVPKLTRAAFQKFGFSTASLITDWSVIAGPELSQYSLPERLKWPRAAGEGEEGRDPATLILRVDPARALEVQYMTAQIAERVNRYLGYRAVADVRILQAPLPAFEMRAETPAPALSARPRDIVAPGLDQIGDDKLRAALERMKAGIAGRR